MNMLPTILFLNNRYINSLDELKKYITTNLNEGQKKELVASVRDGVLINWLKEGDGDSKKIGEDLYNYFDNKNKLVGDETVIIYLANLLGVVPPPQKHYKFNEHLLFVDCNFTQSYNELLDNHVADGVNSETNVLDVVLALQRQKGVVKDNSTIHILKGVDCLNLVFRYKILKPENDYVTFTFGFNLDKEYEKLNPDPRTLWLGHTKNTINEVSQTIKIKGLPKDSTLSVKYDNEEVVCFKLDNSANTDQRAEVKEDTFGRNGKKVNLVARIHTENGYGFYDGDGDLVLKPEYQPLKNEMYPDIDFGFYYQQGNDNSKELYHIDEEGYRYLGVFSDVIPLNEEYVAFRRTEESIFYGIIDFTGKSILEDNKVGKIYGISKEGCLVCDVRPSTQGLANLQGEELEKKLDFSHYFVSPYSDLICSCSISNRYKYYHNYYRDFQLFYARFNSEFKEGIKIERCFDTLKSILLYNHYILVKGEHRGEECCTEWFNDQRREAVCFAYSQLQAWQMKPLFPLLKINTKFKAPIDNDGFEFSEISPVVVTNSWAVIHNNKRLNLYDHRENRFVLIKEMKNSAKNLFVVYGASHGQDLLYSAASSINLLKLLKKGNETSVERVKIEMKTRCNGISSVVSYGGYIVVRYLYQAEGGGVTACSLIITSEGKVLFQDIWGEFPYVCGPFDNEYYYLSNGELFRMDKDKSNKMKLSNHLDAKELYPLGTTGHFVVKLEDRCQIIDNQGGKLGLYFDSFNLQVNNCCEEMVMDYNYNSIYLPVKNAKGKCGLIDTNGKVIVPCLYEPDEIEDLDSIFKREGIVLF